MIRGPTVLVLTQAVLSGLQTTVEGLASWLGRAEREVRRCLNAAVSCGDLSPSVVAILRQVLGERKRRKTATKSTIGRKTASSSRACVSVPETENKIEIESRRTSEPENLVRLEPCPPPLRGSIVRSVLKKAGWSAEFTWTELETLERRLKHLDIATVKAVAARYADDQDAILAARSMVAIFLSNLPRYLSEVRDGVPVNAARTLRKERQRGEPVAFVKPLEEAPVRTVQAVSAPYAARWRAACEGLAADVVIETESDRRLVLALRALPVQPPQVDNMGRIVGGRTENAWLLAVQGAWRDVTGEALPTSDVLAGDYWSSASAAVVASVA